MTNNSASIRARLYNISKKENISFQLIILRFLHERFLYRLSLSDFADKFLLKGGVLLYAFEGSKTRSTKDIDFLGNNISNDEDLIRNAIKEVCSIEYKDDCAWFDPESVICQTISEDDKYSGLRLFIDSGFDTIMLRIQIDIGFGDVVMPLPFTIDYPLLISELKPPKVKVYSVESVIAEKFHAMIELSTVNSRMKDFYDVYTLIFSSRYSKINLQLAIMSTFKRRNTPYIQNHALFTEEFFTNSTRIRMWKTFLKKFRLNENIEFKNVVETITKELTPVWESLK